MNHTKSVLQELERQLESLQDYQTHNEDVAALVSWKCSELDKRIAFLRG
jgi:hypothetical protein